MKEELHDVVHRASMDTIGHKKPNSGYGYYLMLGEVNKPLECVEMLRKLNEAITLMYELSDCGYYLDYIWNAGTTQDKWLKENGFDDDYFCARAEELEKLRTLLFGDNLNWHELYEKLYKDLLYHEAYWNAFHDDMYSKEHNKCQSLERKIVKLEEQLRQKGE